MSMPRSGPGRGEAVTLLTADQHIEVSTLTADHAGAYAAAIAKRLGWVMPKRAQIAGHRSKLLILPRT